MHLVVQAPRVSDADVAALLRVIGAERAIRLGDGAVRIAAVAPSDTIAQYCDANSSKELAAIAAQRVAFELRLIRTVLDGLGDFLIDPGSVAATQQRLERTLCKCRHRRAKQVCECTVGMHRTSVGRRERDGQRRVLMQ